MSYLLHGWGEDEKTGWSNQGHMANIMDGLRRCRGKAVPH